MSEKEKIGRNETKKWLEIMLNHKLSDMGLLSKEIAELVHQVKYFEIMDEPFQNQVIEELNERIRKKGWKQIILEEELLK